MWLLVAEALLALVLLLGIVAWTMTAARRGREEATRADEAGSGAASPRDPH